MKESTHRCTQIQCEFYLNGGCQACDSCKAEPYVMTDSCHNCFACEKIPNNLRWGESGLLQIKQSVPEISNEDIEVLDEMIELLEVIK